jgi:hypothetical protein
VTVSVWKRACVRQKALVMDGWRCTPEDISDPGGGVLRGVGSREGRTAAGAAGGAGLQGKPRRTRTAGWKAAPQCAAVPGRRAAATRAPPGTEETGYLLRHHDRDALLVSLSLDTLPSYLADRQR